MMRLIFIWIGLAVLSLANAAAPQPKFTVVPAVANSNVIRMFNSATVTVIYRVTNQTKLARTFTMSPITGVSHVNGGPGSCAKPFILAAGQSCLLHLEIKGSEIPLNGHFGGPKICRMNADGSADPFLCSQPSQANSLNITIIPDSRGIFQFRQNGAAIPGNSITLGSSESGVIELVNAGTGVISNLVINNPSSYLSSNCGATLAPGTHCSITFNIPPAPITGSFTVIATGTNVANSPDILTVNVVQVYAYVTNVTPNTVSKCIIDSNGLFSSCTPTGGGFVSPVGIAINKAANMAYVTNAFGSSVSQCLIDVNGDFTGCVLVGLPSDPEGIGLNPDATIAYIASTSGTIMQCSLNPDGTINSCVDQSVPGINIPFNIAINNANRLAYITDDCCGRVIKCIVGVNGALGSCTDSIDSFSLPNGIVLNNANTLAYVVNQASPGEGIAICPIVNGDFGVCSLFTDALFVNPTGIALNPSGTRAYIADLDDIVVVCNVDVNGSLSACVDSGQSFSQSFGIALTH